MLNEQKQQKETIVFGNDSVAVQKYLAGIPGGRTLDLSGFDGDVVYAGTVLVEDAAGNIKPLGLTPGAAGQQGTYAAKDAADKYAGILYRTILKKNPAASIMIQGVVNGKVIPAPLPDDFKAAFPAISEVADLEPDTADTCPCGNAPVAAPTN